MMIEFLTHMVMSLGMSMMIVGAGFVYWGLTGEDDK